MNPLAYIIGIPLGLWLSDVISRSPEIIAREKERHAQAMEKRFGADRRKYQEWQTHCDNVEEAGRRQRAEFRKRNQK